MQVELFHKLLQRNKKKTHTVGAEETYVYNEGSINSFVQKKSAS
jgi:hypothetical protein